MENSKGQSARRKEHSAWRKALTDNKSTDNRKTEGSMKEAEKS